MDTTEKNRDKNFRRLLAGVVAACILFMLVSVELWILPWFLGAPREILLFRFAAIPGSTVEGQEINSLGFSGDVVTNPKPENTLRILLLGGSVVFRHHLGEALKSELQSHSQDKKIEVLDAGLPMHSSRSDLYKMQYLAKYQFDYVIYYNGINDLWMNAKYPLGFQQDYSHYDAWYRKYRLFRYSLIAQYVYQAWWKAYNVINSRNYDRWDFNHENYASLATFHDNILSLVDVAEQHHGKVILATFAYTIPDNYTREAFRKRLLGYVPTPGYYSTPVELWGSPDYVSTGLKRTNLVLKDIANSRNLALIDIDREFSGKIHLFGDVCHFNPEGTHLFVEQVAGYFYQHHLLD